MTYPIISMGTTSGSFSNSSDVSSNVFESDITCIRLFTGPRKVLPRFSKLPIPYGIDTINIALCLSGMLWSHPVNILAISTKKLNALFLLQNAEWTFIFWSFFKIMSFNLISNTYPYQLGRKVLYETASILCSKKYSWAL